MKNLAIVCTVLLVLPFILGYIQCGLKKGIHVTKVYYRYFAFINIVLAALFVAGRLFFMGPEAAATSGWTYSPIFHLYGIALLSMALVSVFLIFKNEQTLLVPAMYWSCFVVLSSVSHLVQVATHEIKNVNIILVHVGYNILVTLVLLFFITKLNRHFRSRNEVSFEPSTDHG